MSSLLYRLIGYNFLFIAVVYKITKGEFTRIRREKFLEEQEKLFHDLKDGESEEEKAAWEQRCIILKKRHDEWRRSEAKYAEIERAKRKYREESAIQMERNQQREKSLRLQEAVNRMQIRLKEKKAKEKEAMQALKKEHELTLELDRRLEANREAKREVAVRKAELRLARRAKNSKRRETDHMI